MTDVMTATARRERVVEIDQRLAEIDTEYLGGVLPSEARTEWDELVEERADHNEAIADAEKREEQLERFAKDHGEEKASLVDDGEDDKPRRGLSGERPKSVKAVQTTAGKRVKDIYDLPEYRKATSSDEEYFALVRDGARRAVENSEIPGYDVDEAKAKESVMRLLKSVDTNGELARRILKTGSELYQRAFGKAVMAGTVGVLTPEEHRALSTSGSSGGFAVPFTLDPSLVLTTDGSINPLRQISRVIQITTTTWQGVTSGNVTVSRAAEGTEATDGSPALAQPSVTPTRVQGFVPFSVEIDQDWGALQSEITMLIQERKDEEEADSFVNGDGAGVNPAGVVATLPAGSEVPTAGVGTFASEDVYAVSEALPPRFRTRASWMANLAVYNAIRQFGTTDGHELWERIGADTPSLLLGRRAYEASEMSDQPAATGQRTLLYGDFTKFVIVDRVGMNVELVPHLFGTTNNFPTGQRGLYAIWRNSSLVLVPNAFRILTVA